MSWSICCLRKSRALAESAVSGDWRTGFEFLEVGVKYFFWLDINKYILHPCRLITSKFAFKNWPTPSGNNITAKGKKLKGQPGLLLESVGSLDRANPLSVKASVFCCLKL